MSVNQVVVAVMAIFAVAGAVDRIIGNKIGFGKKFEEAFKAMGALALSMVGMMVMAPVIADVLSPVIVPIFKAIGADPSMFAGIFLAIDMGGAPMAKEMALTPEAYELGGIIVGSMLGATIVFTIPVSFEIAGGDKAYIAKGILIGVITIPIGCFVGGVLAGFPIKMVLVNLIPATVISVLIALGMWKIQEKMIKGFIVFGKFILIVSTVGLALGILDQLVGIKPLANIGSISDSFAIVAGEVLVLAGAFPLVFFVTKVLKKPLEKLGNKMGINQVAASSFIMALANSIPMFYSMKDMDKNGKVIATAFAVSGSFILGDHLGFIATYEPSMMIPLLLGKIVAAITAVIVALVFLKNLKKI